MPDQNRSKGFSTKLKQDLARLIDPEQDIKLSAKDEWNWVQRVEEAFHKAGQDALQKGIENPLAWSLEQANKIPSPPGLKDLSWLVMKINTLSRKGKPRRATHADGETPVWVQKVGEIEIPMMLSIRAKLDDFRVLLTDRVSFVPVINDLRDWVYFRLAHLWADGLLPRLGRCQKCSRFLLAKTRRKTKYCSTRCGQSATAVDRVRKSRERRTTWQKAWESLQRILADMDAIEHKQKLQRPQSEGQVLAEAEKAREKACTAFATAYPRQKGQSYKEGRAFLADAKKKVLQLQKRVKGY